MGLAYSVSIAVQITVAAVGLFPGLTLPCVGSSWCLLVPMLLLLMSLSWLESCGGPVMLVNPQLPLP